MFYPETKFRRKITFVEGLDQTGKSILTRGLNYASGHDCMVYPRGPVSRIVMTKFFANHIGEQQFPVVVRAKEYKKKYLDKIYDVIRELADHDMLAVIYLHADPEEVQRRMKKNGHYILTQHVLRVQHGLFRIELGQLPRRVPVLQLDTTTRSQGLVLQDAMNWMGLNRCSDYEPHYPPSCLERKGT